MFLHQLNWDKLNFAMMQVDDHVRIRLISKLIKGISKFFKNYLSIFSNYYYEVITATSFVLPSAGVLSVIFILDLNDSESAKLTYGSSL